MKKAGRPKQEVKKDVYIKFMVTQEENEIINNLAKEFNMNKSKFIRTLLLADEISTNFVKNWHKLPIAKHLIEMADHLRGVKIENIKIPLEEGAKILIENGKVKIITDDQILDISDSVKIVTSNSE